MWQKYGIFQILSDCFSGASVLWLNSLSQFNHVQGRLEKDYALCKGSHLTQDSSTTIHSTFYNFGKIVMVKAEKKQKCHCEYVTFPPSLQRCLQKKSCFTL
uniref:Uncharacterized protein n=1 Tax=Micrurus lemniscatus lemniscatus TaxID=129467 RepID=A0A2D4JRG7_MICLE